ncbi:hypothetical protein EZV62_010493 [Acer yangbiense]|uniref:Uncharacterized protein n=1 Tax=Acer yangbiense TaxID=1000413 RepID=A0A5C7I3I5_9ROSI|nr:hypothetical protein EZV62_010493 [Acer yangbiense]
MKHRDLKDEEKVGNINTFSMKKKKNMQRLGGTGLSLEAFANAKSVNNHHNPAFKKKQREFYKNAKCVNKYKKSVKQLSHSNDVSSAAVRQVEREAMIKAKKEGREKAEARRKSTRDKMFKNTRYGQPVMKYRIEHLLETIQGSGPCSINNSFLLVSSEIHWKRLIGDIASLPGLTWEGC